MDYEKAFSRLSETLTGFSLRELQSTGLSEELYAFLEKTLGKQKLETYLRAMASEGEADAELNCSPEELEKFKQQLTTLWYTGNWYPVFPPPAPEEMKASEFPMRVSIHSYQEALVWRAMGKNPSGAKWPGWGSWAMEPSDPAAQLF